MAANCGCILPIIFLIASMVAYFGWHSYWAPILFWVGIPGGFFVGGIVGALLDSMEESAKKHNR